MANIDTIIESIVRMRDDIAAHNQAIDLITEDKSKLEAELMQVMADMNVSQLGSPHGTATVKAKQSLILADWATLSEYVVATGNVQLLQKRLSPVAYNELINAGETVPGVDVFSQSTVSIRRK